MKPILAKRHAVRLDTTGLSRVLPQSQSLIAASRRHVVSTASPTLVGLYWNVGRVVTEFIKSCHGRVLGKRRRLLTELN